MSAHTQGPWSVGSKGDGAPGYVYCDNALGSAVALVYGRDGMNYSAIPHEQKVANAQLIAAAPELLEALEVLFDEANNFSVSGVYFNEECMGHKGLALARAAIAKATGAA